MEMAQVGVRTRARALALAAAAAATTTGTARKRKVNNRELMMSTSYIGPRSTSRRRVLITPENSVSVSPEINTDQRTVIRDRCSSPSSDHASASCCSSYGSSGQRNNNKFADLEAESVEVETSVYYSCRERKETTPSSQLQPASSGELDSTERPSSEANSRRRSTGEKMPTEFELDEFFAVAEKNLKKQFADKYNYDIVKDEPLEGRYEWLRLKP
ncbi:hypothetical protein P3X46_012478 [Hevea brasiliensis]|uniref:Cyclin-dependent kinase inhibitor n=1 Tax=Hevea brasiliensis TaxID=3981 RepID=A0ABQ9MCH5_HEVBR|nr:cyclin-dependent kinase inhibitor 6 [Hevea brasiliensis]KAJ9177240.1 hypothetical protein P3X46_012478 [Hevea brasiliensis]